MGVRGRYRIQANVSFSREGLNTKLGDTQALIQPTFTLHCPFQGGVRERNKSQGTSWASQVWLFPPLELAGGHRPATQPVVRVPGSPGLHPSSASAKTVLPEQEGSKSVGAEHMDSSSLGAPGASWLLGPSDVTHSACGRQVSGASGSCRLLLTALPTKVAQPCRPHPHLPSALRWLQAVTS